MIWNSTRKLHQQLASLWGGSCSMQETRCLNDFELLKCAWDQQSLPKGVGIKFIWGGRRGGRARMKHFENIYMVQSPVYGFSAIICGLTAKLLSLSHSHLRAMMSEYVFFFTSVLSWFLLGVLKQPSWAHLKEEKGDTYPKASLHGEAAQGDKPPLWAHSPSVSNIIPSFPTWLKPRWKMFCCTGASICGQLFDTNNCTVRLLGRGEAQVSLRGTSGSPWQRRTHSLCLPDPLRLLPGPFWPLSHFSAQMWKLLHSIRRLGSS